MRCSGLILSQLLFLCWVVGVLKVVGVSFLLPAVNDQSCLCFSLPPSKQTNRSSSAGCVCSLPFGRISVYVVTVGTLCMLACMLAWMCVRACDVVCVCFASWLSRVGKWVDCVWWVKKRAVRSYLLAPTMEQGENLVWDDSACYKNVGSNSIEARWCRRHGTLQNTRSDELPRTLLETLLRGFDRGVDG